MVTKLSSPLAPRVPVMRLFFFHLRCDSKQGSVFWTTRQNYKTALGLPHRLKCGENLYLSIHSACTTQSIFVRAPACAHLQTPFFALSSPAPIYRLSLEVYTNCETKVPLGNGLSRNADLGTASGTGPTHGHSLISFGLN